MGEENWVREASASGALVPVDPLRLVLRRELVDKTELVSILGAARKRADDSSKLILVPDPLSSHPTYYEVSVEDIVEIDQEIIISDSEGNSFQLVRAWFREGTVCVRSELICMRRMGLPRHVFGLDPEP